MNIFERTRRKREEDAGTKPKAEPKKASDKKEMSREEFFYGRPPQSKKWVEK